jgi:hypothetical protein
MSIGGSNQKIEQVRRELRPGDALQGDVVGARMDHRVGAEVGVIEHVLDRGKAEAPQVKNIVRLFSSPAIRRFFWRDFG